MTLFVTDESTVFECFVSLDVALREALGPRTYNNEVETAFRNLAEVCGIDLREVGEATYHRMGRI